MRAALVVLVVALALAGCSARPPSSTSNATSASSTSATTPAPAKLVHWHAKFQVWVDDAQLDLSDARFEGRSANFGGRLYLPAHLHSPSDIVHNEAHEGEGTMSTFFEFSLGGKLSDEQIVVPEGARGVPVGSYHADATHSVRMFVDHANATAWERVASIPAYSFQNGDRILVLFGNDSDARVAEFEAAFPPFDPANVR